ncbi:hypothetical protein C8R28_100487 [Nitrosomonas ureae]|uniref:Uncharacterized protein n=1 Tax=Nitrosomonas ureae TaxID=44577 RepID=A0A286A2V8_9PROT|nr:hypothetical protein C8R28_100487 [Nitrosomonas ureae]SOD16243.1 hypothetical protein SAMN06297164_0311 [Nitrosomonas ureae]
MSNEIRIASWWEMTLLVVAYAIPLFFYYYSYLTGEGHWFSRSGSLMVILGAFLEYRNFGIQQYLREKRDETWKPDPIIVNQLRSRKPFDILLLTSLVLGTAIWGYGDLLFNNT